MMRPTPLRGTLLLAAHLLVACTASAPPAVAPGPSTGSSPSAPPLIPAPRAREPAASAPPMAELHWRYEGSRDHEPHGPGLGRSHRWRSAAGWADVYVYDLRRRNWAPGVADAQFDTHFRRTVDEVRQLAATGAYRQLRIGAVRDVQISGMTFRSISFHYVILPANRPVESWTFLTAHQGRLLKYRLSFLQAPEGMDSGAAAQRFIETDLRTGPDTPPSRNAREV